MVYGTAQQKVVVQPLWPQEAPGKSRLQQVLNYLQQIWGQMATRVNATPVVSNGIGPTNLPVGSSPFTYTNNDGYDENIVIGGTNLTGLSIVRNGVPFAMPFDEGSFHLAPTDGVILTWTGGSAPTVVKVPW